MERSAQPSSRAGFAPARNTSHSAPGSSNPFESLEDEATQAVRVPPELLGLAREDSSASATKAYQVPPELLELARQNKEKRRAAAQQVERSEPAPAAQPQARPESERAPSVIVADADLAPSSAPELGPSIPPALPVPPPLPALAAPQNAWRRERAPELEAQPDFRDRAAPRRAARWLLAALCLIALSAAGVVGGRLVRDHLAPAPPAPSLRQL